MLFAWIQWAKTKNSYKNKNNLYLKLYINLEITGNLLKKKC